jgi:hypothetical protein
MTIKMSDMKSQELRTYINRLNNQNAQDSIFRRKIGPNVEVAKVWSGPRSRYPGFVGVFFFITNTDGEYVAAVYDMQDDLHWYVVPKHRKKGHLTQSLKQSILPYLFDAGRTSQKISIDVYAIGDRNFAASKALATSIGFKPLEGSHCDFELNASDFDYSEANLRDTNLELSEDRIKQLAERIGEAKTILNKISNELTMAYKDDGELSEVVKLVESYKWKIEDVMWKHRKA